MTSSTYKNKTMTTRTRMRRVVLYHIFTAILLILSHSSFIVMSSSSMGVVVGAIMSFSACVRQIWGRRLPEGRIE